MVARRGPGRVAGSCESQRAGPRDQRSWRYPQQLSRPNLVSLESTPETGLSEMSVTPVSVYPDTRLPVVAKSTPASTPRLAIFSGYCCEVAAIRPSTTPPTPAHPPSTETMSTCPCLPRFFSAVYAPNADGSLIV